ncbi:hypothetical protein ACPCG0_07100 [Propionibacteriaceae bacterium Y1923]
MSDMPTPPLIHWQGLEFEVTDSGDLGQVTEQDGGQVLLRALRVELPMPWALGEVTLLSTEVEQQWTHPDGPTAVVRQVWEEAWTLRVTLLNKGDAQVSVPAPRLRFSATWPTRRWLGGGEATIAVDPGRAQQLLLTQLRGQAQQVDGQLLLTPDPLVLAAHTEDHGPGQFQVSWRGAWLDDHTQVARVLPFWWPERVALAEGEEVVLSLPDAATTASREIRTSLEDEDTWIGAPPGRHQVHVHNRLGTTTIDLWWGRNLDSAKHREASRILDVTDPRTCEPWEAWIVTCAADTLGPEEVGDYLVTAVEESCARSGPVHPLEVMTVSSWLADNPGADDIWVGLEDLVTRMPTVPGSQLALVHTRLLAMQLGRTSPTLRARRSPVAEQLSRVEQAMCRVEAGLLNPADEPDEDAWRVAGLLGAGLPGETVSLVRLAQVHTLTSLYPEHWDLTARWPVPLAVARQAARQKVVASIDLPDGCEAFGWVLAGL